MVLEARLYMQICEWITDAVCSSSPKARNYLTVFWCLIICVPLALPESDYGNYCQDPTSVGVQYVLSWIFRNFGGSCYIYKRWFHIYLVFYVWSFHGLRPLVNIASKHLPKSPTWAALSLSASMTMGMAMALWHYPNYALEDGSGLAFLPLEVGVDIIQPMLFALGMTYLPFNMAWWGNTTLGCYTFHFYFKDHFTSLFEHISYGLGGDPTGLVLFIVILGICLAFTSVCGPIGHYILLSPTLVYQRLMRLQNARKRARELDVTSEKK